MDRRSFLAILLSTLVFVLFNIYFFPKPKPKPRPAPHADSVAAAPAPATTPAPADTAEKGPRTTLFTPAAAESLFTVQIDGARVRFSTKGGGITSWQLPAFDGVDGKPVDLVRQGPEPVTAIDFGGQKVDLSEAPFSVDTRELAGGGKAVTFRTELTGGTTVIKRFRLGTKTSLYDYEVEVDGVPASATDPVLEVGWHGIPRAERNERPDKTSFGAILAVGKDIQRVGAGKFRKEKEKRYEGLVHWVGARNKYFFAGIVPPPNVATAAIASGDAATDLAGAAVRVPLVAGADSRHIFKLYLGPLDYWKLKELGIGLEGAVDLGWKIILPLSQLLLWLMVMGYKFIPNYGVVIIILSAVTRILFYPLTKSSMRSMRSMQKIQPEMERLRNRYKDDPARLNQEVMGLYKKHGVNPLGGCLPTLLQMPVFIALYTVLANSIELRHANFALWINDLSAPDVLLKIGTFSLHALPILMAATMFWQQKLTPTDPRQAALTYMMPVMMLFFLYSFPSGLALYWTVVNVLSVAQQYLLNRELAEA